jgi:erythronate-4-phosphate dehydrogenase
MSKKVPLSSARILVDPSIPGAVSAFGLLGSVEVFDPATIADRPESVADADVLVFRSDLRIDRHLLRAMPRLRVLATPVIGLDHVNLAALELLRHDGREPPVLVHAPGSTAGGVADFVTCGIVAAFPELEAGGPPPVVGIVGMGNCGTALARRLDFLGIPWMPHDPPREAREHGAFRGVPFDALYRCDVVTFHVPLVGPGSSPWPTEGMIDARVLGDLARSGVRLLVNTSRGAILDEAALLNRLQKGSGGFDAFLDVYLNEPYPDPALVQECMFATPHVAGSVIEGRARALRMVLDGTARCLGLDQESLAASLPTVSPTGTEPTREGAPVSIHALIRSMAGMEGVSQRFKTIYRTVPDRDRRRVFREQRAQAMRSEIPWGAFGMKPD